MIYSFQDVPVRRTAIFGNIDRGTIFEFNDKVYLKLRPAGNTNVLHLEDNELVSFHDSGVLIIPLKYTLTLSYPTL